MMKIIRIIQGLGQSMITLLGLIFIVGALAIPYVLINIPLIIIFWIFLSVSCLLVLLQILRSMNIKYILMHIFFVCICLYFFYTKSSIDGIMMITLLIGVPIGVHIFDILQIIHNRKDPQILISLFLIIMLYSYSLAEFLLGNMKNPYNSIGVLYTAGVMTPLVLYAILLARDLFCKKISSHKNI